MRRSVPRVRRLAASAAASGLICGIGVTNGLVSRHESHVASPLANKIRESNRQINDTLEFCSIPGVRLQIAELFA